MKQPILFGSIDQGTTSTRFILYEYNIFNHDLKKLLVHQIEHDNIYPKPGWVEQDPMELMKNTVICIDTVIRQFCEEHKIPLENIGQHLRGIGVTNQRETTVLWDKITGEPLFNAIVWNDLRTASLVEHLIKENESKGGQSSVLDKCGLPFSTYFSGMKLKWLIEKSGSEKVANAISRGTCMFGTIDTWLIWNLTGGASHVTDVTNASRTMLMNLNTCEWDDSLFEVLGLPKPGKGILFPEIKSCAEDFGSINMPLERIARLIGEQPHPFSANGIHITGVVGDQQGATIGQKCFRIGEAKVTYGTGCFMIMNIGKDKPFKVSTHGLLTTVAYQFGKNRPVTYGLEGSVAVAGAGVKWLQKNMKFINSPAESENVASTVEDSGGVAFVPAFSGLFAPYWDNSARGTIVGLTQFSTSAHIVRAMLESVCFQSKEVLCSMEKDAGVTLKLLKVDGGMSRNNLTMQFQSDLLNVVVVRPEDIETTAKGAAMCAVVGCGVYDYEAPALEEGGQPMDLMTPSESVMKSFDGNTFIPKMGDKEREFKCKQWQLAITKARGWVIE